MPPSCNGNSGTAFWAPLYALHTCPRCGCQVSRYSESTHYASVGPGDDEVLRVRARKFGLDGQCGHIVDRHGALVEDRAILDHVLRARGHSARSVKAFEKLLGTGLSMTQSMPLADHALLDNVLALQLREEQEQPLQSLVDTGALTAATATSFGKRTCGLMAMTRIVGRHLLMVGTAQMREQWIAELTALAPRVTVQRHKRPARVEVQVFDPAGASRCTIGVYSARTRGKLDGPRVVGCFDEVDRLPARRAGHHALPVSVTLSMICQSACPIADLERCESKFPSGSGRYPRRGPLLIQKGTGDQTSCCRSCHVKPNSELQVYLRLWA